jgi:hypothetical protein
MQNSRGFVECLVTGYALHMQDVMFEDVLLTSVLIFSLLYIVSYCNYFLISSAYRIWQKMEKCKGGKVVANHAFPVSNVGIIFPGRAVTSIYSLHISSKKLRRCCQGDMTVKGCYVSRVGEVVMKERRIQHATGIVRIVNA